MVCPRFPQSPVSPGFLGLLASRRLHHWTLNGGDGNPRRIVRLDACRLWRRVRPIGQRLAVS